MSIKKLEQMLKKLEESSKTSKGGFLGIGHDAKRSLKKSGGRKTKEAKCDCGAHVLKGGKWYQWLSPESWIKGETRETTQRKKTAAEERTEAEIVEGIETGKYKKEHGQWFQKVGKTDNYRLATGKKKDHLNTYGGAITGGKAPCPCNCSTAGGVTTGGGLMGGMTDFSGSGKKSNCEACGAGLMGGVYVGGSDAQYSGSKSLLVNPAKQRPGRMRSDLRSYNSSTKQRGSRNTKGGMLLGGEGDIANFAGVEGGNVANFAGVGGGGKKAKTRGTRKIGPAVGGMLLGGEGDVTNFAGVEGGNVANFAGVGGGRYKKGVSAKAPQLNAWRDHLAKVKQQNPGKSLKECMQIASKSYKK